MALFPFEDPINPDYKQPCETDPDVCTACGGQDEPVLPDRRCARCQDNGNPAHSWCLHG